MAGIQQALAQQGRCRFNNVKTWLQRDAKHFERAGVFGAGWGQFKLGGVGAFQQRDHARFHIIVRNAPAMFFCFFRRGRGQRGRQVAHAFCLGVFARDQFVIEAMHALEPADDLGIAVGSQIAHNATGNMVFDLKGRCFHLAYGYRQQRRRFFAFCKALDHAKGRSRKFEQGWRGTCAHTQRKAAGIVQRPTRIINQPGRQRQLVFGVFIQRASESDRFDRLAFFFFWRKLRLDGFARGLQRDLARPLHGNGGGEAHRHGANRHAGRFGIWAFAAEIGFQRRLHLVVPRLRVLVHRSAAAFVAAERKLYLGL